MAQNILIVRRRLKPNKQYLHIDALPAASAAGVLTVCMLNVATT